MKIKNVQVKHTYSYYVITQHKFSIKSSFKGHCIAFYLEITYF